MTDTHPAMDRGPHRHPLTGWWCLLLIGALLLSGCAAWPRPTQSAATGLAGPVGACADFFAALDRKVVTDDAVNAGYARIGRHPYLRADRFVASFATEVDDRRAFDAWVAHMQTRDQRARRIEIANLTDQSVAALRPDGSRQALNRMVAECGDRLATHDLATRADRRRLIERVHVPDAYLDSRRIVGLYPIVALFVSDGVDRWHRTARDQFSPGPPSGWQSLRYVPERRSDPASARPIVRQAPRDALGIPVYTESEKKRLFEAFAPTWEVQYRSDSDRIGRPHWTAAGRPGVDTAQPVSYTRLNYTRFEGAVLTQLNYVVWFPSRPKDGPLDLYGGVLDGLTYRVTLDRRGLPILYETVHNCGCYYAAYPTGRLQPRESIDYAEPPLILAAPRVTDPRARMVVALESRTHYVRHLFLSTAAHRQGDRVYVQADYAALNQLSLPDGRGRSLFNRYGLVSGSERLERFLFWPTGVPSAGAMRQWGRHAVAFVGKRHFDDPFYLDRMFVRYLPQQTVPVEN